MELSKSRRVFVVGVGMTKFEKPGSRNDFDYPDMAKEAGTKALQDAGLNYSDIKAAVAGYVYGDSTCGQRALYQLGMTGIPVYNVNNNCSTGSTALILAKHFIENGSADCVMAMGFEKMERGSLMSKFSDRTSPLDKHIEVMSENYGFEPSPAVIQIFGNAGREHMKRYGTKAETFAKIAWKNHKHSVNNPYSQFQDEYTLQQILDSTKVFHPLTKLQCCPTSDGSAVAIVASEEFVRKHNLQTQAVEILAMEMTTDLPSTLNEKNAIKLAGYDMTKLAADKVFKKAGVDVKSVDVVELHDCFSANELISYEALGLCAEGCAEQMVEKGDNTYGGKYVVNPSGGLISKGHPLGATGLAQCSELCWQLRDKAGKRQVPNAKIALQHNIGLGGAVVVGLYQLGFPQQQQQRGSADLGGRGDSNNEESTFKSANVINDIRNVLKKDGARIVQKLKAVYCFKVRRGNKEGIWVVDVKNGNGSVTFGSKQKADCTIAMSDEDMYLMVSGKLNPQQAFMKGKLQISGNMGLAMKLREILPKRVTSKL